MDFGMTVLVFSATTALSAFVLLAVYRVLMTKAEAVSMDADSVANDPMRRFVSPARFVTIRFCSMVAVVFLVVCFLAVKGVFSFFVVLPVAVGAGVVGWKLPMAWLKRKLRKRKEAFDAQILNLTMNLSNGLKSGQALPQALDAVAKRITPPMQEELAVVLRETHLGLDLPEALERLHSRMPGEDLRLLVTTVKLTLQTGGSLADVLGRMTEMIRARTEFQAKLKTMTAQGRFQAIAMSLAPAFVYVLLRLIDPDLMKPLTSTVTGICAVCVVVVMLLIGYAIIKKIVTIEV